MSFQGDYNPNQFVEGNWGTYPPITSPAGATLYQPGMWWRFDRNGTFNGIPVETNDQVFVDGRGRRIGDLLIGSYLIGGDPFDDWPVELTSWVVYFLEDDPWQADPVPFSGELIGDTGWRAVVEVLHDHDTPGWEWVDWTSQVVSATVRRGSDGGAINPIPVDVLIVEVLDDAATFYRIEPDEASPNVASPIRVGVFDPAQVYYPLGTGRIDALDDVHDAPHRIVTVEAYGIVSDLVAAATSVSLPREGSTARLERYWSEIGLDWAPVSYPTTPGIELKSVTQGSHTDDQLVRLHADMIARLNAWAMENDARGRVRFVNFPRDLDGPEYVITDQAPVVGGRRYRGAWLNPPDYPDPAPARGDWWAVKTPATLPNGGRTTINDRLVYAGGAEGWVVERDGRPGGHTARYRSDLAELVNDVIIIAEDSATIAQRTDQASIDRHKRRGFGYGLPWIVTEPQSTSSLSVAADALIARTPWLRDRVVSVGADTRTDPAWLAVLAELDTGDRITTQRQGDLGAELLGQLCGIEHRLDRDHWAATLFTTGVVPWVRSDINARTPSGVDIRTPSGVDVYVPTRKEYPTS